MQKAEESITYIDDNGEEQTVVVETINGDVLSKVAALIGVNPSPRCLTLDENSSDMQASIESGDAYYVTLAQKIIEDPDGGEPKIFGHSIAVVGYTRGVITGKIYTYIIWDPMEGEKEIPAGSL